jgi:hypothetical protein
MARESVDKTHIAAAHSYEWVVANVVCIMRSSTFISLSIAAFRCVSAKPHEDGNRNESTTTIITGSASLACATGEAKSYVYTILQES